VSRSRRNELIAGLAIALGSTGAIAFVVSVSGIPHDGHGLVLMVAILGPVGVLTVLSTTWLLARRAQLGSLRHQAALIGAIVAGQMLLAIGLFVWLMFVSGTDALLTGLVALYAGLLGAWAARAFERRLLSDVGEIRGGLSAVGSGRRDVRLQVAGTDEIAQLAGDVQMMVSRLAEEEQSRAVAQAAHRELLAAVSHDLRTPITSMRLLADALQDHLVEEDSRAEYTARIGVHLQSLSGLIDDLFELSRLEAGDIHWSMNTVSLGELVSETVEAMRPDAAARSVAMSAELPESLQVTRANPEQIQRVLFNLIQNAIRHTPADGSITVRCERAPDCVEIEVSDTGEGIAPGERERVFEPFVQGSNQPARSGGSAGLGLAISRAIVEAHGGRIWLAESRIGTCVRFSLPSDSLVAA